jgi:hypothetical protein
MNIRKVNAGYFTSRNFKIYNSFLVLSGSQVNELTAGQAVNLDGEKEVKLRG